MEKVKQEEMMRWMQNGEDEKKEENYYGFVSSPIHGLMATQEVENYMDRITKQREALSQWERSGHGKSDGKASLLELERSLHSSYDFEELLKERRRESQHYDDDGDLLTQMTQTTQTPPYTSALESPDLLASFRRQHYRGHSKNDNDRRSDNRAKRRVVPTSSPPHCILEVDYRRRHANGYACRLFRPIIWLTATSPHRLSIPHKFFRIRKRKMKYRTVNQQQCYRMKQIRI